MEVYSVDEAFVDLSGFTIDQLPVIAREIRETVEEWTGIKVSVGVALNKVLAKSLPIRFSKKINNVQDVLLYLIPKKRSQALQKTPVGDIWEWAEGMRTAYRKTGEYLMPYNYGMLSEEFARTHL